MGAVIECYFSCSIGLQFQLFGRAAISVARKGCNFSCSVVLISLTKPHLCGRRHGIIGPQTTNMLFITLKLARGGTGH